MKTLQEIWDKLESLETFSTAQGQIIERLESQNKALLYANGVSPEWTVHRVSGTGANGGYCSLAFDSEGMPAIAFSFAEFSGDSSRVASYNSSPASWQTDFPDFASSVGSYASLKFNPSGNLAVSYWDSGNQRLKFAMHNGSTWDVSIVDESANVGKFSSLAFGAAGMPGISYFDDTSDAVKYASFDGSTWTATTIDSTGIVGRSTSLAFSPQNQPAITYTDQTNDDVKFAMFDGTTWAISIVDPDAPNPDSTSLAFTAPGNNPNLQFARKQENTWAFTDIDQEVRGGVMNTVSLAFGPDALPAVSYLRTNPTTIDAEVYFATTSTTPPAP